MKSIDRKYKVLAVNRGTGKTHTDKDSLLLLATDNAVPATLQFYYEECQRLGADGGHLDSIELLLDRVKEFRYNNPSICKTPDMSEKERPIQLEGKFKD